ncbi:MAG: YybH family protein [bacterium]
MKNSMFILLTVLLSYVAFYACGTPVQKFDAAQVQQAIEDANAKFAEAFNSGDAAAVAALYTDDATLLPPNSTMIQGNEGVQNFWNGAMAMGIKDVALTTVDVSGGGDLAYEIGKYSLTIQAEGQAAIKDEGKYVVVWKKTTEGGWKLQADIWNSSLPLPSQDVTNK